MDPTVPLSDYFSTGLWTIGIVVVVLLIVVGFIMHVRDWFKG